MMSPDPAGVEGRPSLADVTGYQIQTKTFDSHRMMCYNMRNI